MNPQAICFFDFDHTLFDTDRFFHVDVREKFLELGIDIAFWDCAYEEALRQSSRKNETTIPYLDLLFLRSGVLMIIDIFYIKTKKVACG